MKSLGLSLALLFSVLAAYAPVHAKNEPEPQPKPKVVFLDPGHQKKGNNALEQDGPGSKTKKPKVSSGTQGVATKKPEYVLTLEISMKLKAELEGRGYKVLMSRTKHEVDISNKERALMANKAQADLVIRIHADGDKSAKTQGFSVLYPAKGKVPAAVYAGSKLAAERIHSGMKAGLDTKPRGVVARTDLTGFNWSKVPVTLVEAGFMTNPAEDKKLSDGKFQDKIAGSIADGVDAYFQE